MEDDEPGRSPAQISHNQQQEGPQSSRRAKAVVAQLRRRVLGHQRSGLFSTSPAFAFSPSLDQSTESQLRRRRRLLVAKLISPSSVPPELGDDDESTLLHEEVATTDKTGPVKLAQAQQQPPPPSLVDDQLRDDAGSLPRTHSTASIDEEGNQKVCKICLAGNSISRDWVHPCKCGGTIRWVHQDCLNQWRKAGFRADSYRTCELCHTKFKVISISLPLSFFVTRFLDNPREVLNLGLLLPPFCVYCCVLALFFVFWCFMRTIGSIGPCLIFAFPLCILRLASQNLSLVLQFLKVLLVVLAICFVVFIFGYAGKLVIFFLLSVMELFLPVSSPSPGATAIATTSLLASSSLFTEHIGWDLNFAHFFISASVSSSMVFSFLLARQVFTFFRRHSHEIVLNFDPNDTDTKPTHQRSPSSVVSM